MEGGHVYYTPPPIGDNSPGQGATLMDGYPAKHLQADIFNFQLLSSTSWQDQIKLNSFFFPSAKEGGPLRHIPLLKPIQGGWSPKAHTFIQAYTRLEHLSAGVALADPTTGIRAAGEGGQRQIEVYEQVIIASSNTQLTAGHRYRTRHLSGRLEGGKRWPQAYSSTTHAQKKDHMHSRWVK